MGTQEPLLTLLLKRKYTRQKPLSWRAVERGTERTRPDQENQDAVAGFLARPRGTFHKAIVTNDTENRTKCVKTDTDCVFYFT